MVLSGNRSFQIATPVTSRAVDSHPEWEQDPARLVDLVAEERQGRADFQARLAQLQQEEPGSA